MTKALTNRHDILILFDVTNGNPNGDPDAGNMPRIDPNTNKGIITDVCLKRKIRNYLEFFKKDAPGFEILIHQGAVLNTKIDHGIAESEKQPDCGCGAGNSVKDVEISRPERAAKWLCEKYFDVRAFGAVLLHGQRCNERIGVWTSSGPSSIHFWAVLPPDNSLGSCTITRCAVTREEDRGKELYDGTKTCSPVRPLLDQMLCFSSLRRTHGFLRIGSSGFF